MRKKIIASVLSLSLAFTSIPAAGSLIPVQAAAEVTKAEIVRGVNFRDAPSLSGDRIRYLRRGETVTILDKVNRYWYKIRDNGGTVGYVTTMDKYIKVLPNENSETDTVAESGIKGTVIWGVSFRTGPSTRYPRMRYLQKGETVTILEEVNRYWYKIRDEHGTIGYASSNDKYIRVSEPDQACRPG